MNSGMMQTEAALTNDVGAGVVWNVLENNRAAMEKDFGSVAKTFTIVKKKEAKKGGGWKVWKSLGGSGGDKKKRGGPPVVGTPPAAPGQLKGRAAFMVHGCTVESYEVHMRRIADSFFGTVRCCFAACVYVALSLLWFGYDTLQIFLYSVVFFSSGTRTPILFHVRTHNTTQEMCHWVNQLREGGWTHVYMTDKVFDPASDNPALHNPWDAVPSYWEDLVKAVRELGQSRCFFSCHTSEGGPSMIVRA